MSNNYYYLVACLPKIAFEPELQEIDIPVLKQEVSINIPEEDYAHVNMLFAPYDIQNLLNIVLGKKLPFSDKGQLTEEQLKNALDNPAELPSYMSDFVLTYHNGGNNKDEQEVEEEKQHIDPEKYILNRFYDAALASHSAFIRRWFTFDRDIRNIQAAIIARNTGADKESVLVGSGSIAESLLQNTAADFGLRTELDYMDSLLHIIGTSDMLDRERRLDLLRWDIADSLAGQSCFTISYVLSFLQKASIVDRWIKLDKQTGTELFKSMLKDIREKFDIRTATSEDIMLQKIKRKE